MLTAEDERTSTFKPQNISTNKMIYCRAWYIFRNRAFGPSRIFIDPAMNLRSGTKTTVTDQAEAGPPN